MISEQVKAVFKLAVFTCLSVFTELYVSALSMRHEELIVSKKAIEFAKAMANTDVNQRSVAV